MDMVNWPRVGCGAAIFNAGGQILLARRKRDPEAGHWGILGGKVEWGETVEDTVVREIEEEAGVKIRLTGLACLVDQIADDGSSHWVNAVYRADIVDGEPKVMEPEALEDMGWYDLDNLPGPLTRSTEEFLKTTT
ncbi:NUDIX domain-containing protein [Aestuariispira ectoiniformans]|uniref:NUDIX domain-containing protein n=1 Tax=Aestuariispira ectoiniformans TaxID=2775080 RepID=UPI00223BABC1|nr:NUDIX domain-containing protein [Aestuariispira ectoiniformans]